MGESKKEDGKTLLMMRQNTGFKDGMRSIPAGRLDENETIAEGAAREAFEEVGVSINPADLSGPLVMHHKDERGERMYFFFTCEKWNVEPKNIEPDKCGGIEWFDMKKLLHIIYLVILVYLHFQPLNYMEILYATI